LFKIPAILCDKMDNSRNFISTFACTEHLKPKHKNDKYHVTIGLLDLLCIQTLGEHDEKSRTKAPAKIVTTKFQAQVH
jgi:hypothetical protein